MCAFPPESKAPDRQKRTVLYVQISTASARRFLAKKEMLQLLKDYDAVTQDFLGSVSLCLMKHTYCNTKQQ